MHKQNTHIHAKTQRISEKKAYLDFNHTITKVLSKGQLGYICTIKRSLLKSYI
jgi:hypothetical protein